MNDQRNTADLCLSLTAIQLKLFTQKKNLINENRLVLLETWINGPSITEIKSNAQVFLKHKMSKLSYK